jgi:hypothetical protein
VKLVVGEKGLITVKSFPRSIAVLNVTRADVTVMNLGNVVISLVLVGAADLRRPCAW